MTTKLVINGALAALALASAGASATSLSISLVAGAGADNIDPPDLQQGSVYSDTGPVTNSLSASQGGGLATASATIDIGYFAGSADSQAHADPGQIVGGVLVNHYGTSYADVVAQSVESGFLVMPASPMLFGTLGTMVVPIDVSGTLSATVSATPPGGFLTTPYAYAQWSVNAGTLGGTPGLGLLGTVDSFGTLLGDMPGLHTLTIDVVLGVPTELNLQYGLHSSAYVQGTLGVRGQAEGIVAFVSTIRWMGISQVLDADGNPIQFSVSSDSGFDWTQAAPTPVPVPPLPLSLLVAAGASGALFGRRRSRR